VLSGGSQRTGDTEIELIGGQDAATWATATVTQSLQTLRDAVCEDKMLSYRRETTLQAALVLGKSRRLELRDNILRTL